MDSEQTGVSFIMSIFGIEFGDFIATLSLAFTCIIALIGGLYKIISSTKKFELSEEYKKEIISWYSQVSFVIEEILSSHDEQRKVEAVGKLSALIDIGRLYFPNTVKDDKSLKNKPLAHQGHRHIALSYLVRIYRVAKYKDIHEYQKEIIQWKKCFNSVIFFIVSPRDRLKKLKIYADIEVPLSTNDIFID